MYIIKAIPIARGIGTDLLSYWSPIQAESGSVIRVPLRKKTVGAVVISSELASDSKAEIKSADFEVKKVGKTKPRGIISPHFFKAVSDTAQYFASSLGSALFASIPSLVLENYEKFPEAETTTKRTKPRESYVLQKANEDRYGHYKSLIRERFARKESVFMMMPSAEDIKKACSYFEKGIEQFTYTFHGGLTKNEVLSKWKSALASEHPIVIVATGPFLSIPRSDVGLIIVENENSRGYKTQSRPFIDYRFLAEKYAKEIGADLLFGDACLRIETLWREDEGIGTEALVDYAPLSMRSLSTAKDTLVDMKKYKEREKNMRVVSDELMEIISKAHEENGNVFIFASRKGLAPQTVCADCENVLLCENCSAPMVLYGKEDGRFFMCNRCGKKSDAHIKCANCGSWRLVTLGIGTEKVEEELKTLFPDSKIWRLDKNSAPTHKKAMDMTQKWYATPGSILIGTELALLYLDRPIDYCALSTIDALFSIPDFRVNEKIFSIILRLRSLAAKHFLLQTRNPEMSVLYQGVKGNIIDFYREEIESRKQFGFPPFRTFIKISYAGKKEETLEAMEKLGTFLPGYEIDVFPAFIATIKNQYVMHALIKLHRPEWPNKDLSEKLRSLPPSYAINVDPESIL